MTSRLVACLGMLTVWCFCTGSITVTGVASDRAILQEMLQCATYGDVIPPPGMVTISAAGVVSITGTPTNLFGMKLKEIIDDGVGINLFLEKSGDGKAVFCGAYNRGVNGPGRYTMPGNGNQSINLCTLMPLKKDTTTLATQQSFLMHEIYEAWWGKKNSKRFVFAHFEAAKLEADLVEEVHGMKFVRIKHEVVGKPVKCILVHYVKPITKEKKTVKFKMANRFQATEVLPGFLSSYLDRHIFDGCPEVDVCSFDKDDSTTTLNPAPGAGLFNGADYIHRSDDHTYYSLPFESRVVRVDRDGVLDMMFEDVANLSNPQGIRLNEDTGEFFVADSDLDHIVVFDDSTGAFLRTVSNPAISLPAGIDLDESGNLWVASHGLDKVCHITPAGSLMTCITDPALQGPAGVAFDMLEQVLYVVSNGTDQVLRYGSDGTPLGVFAGPPTLSSPWGIDIDGGQLDLRFQPGFLVVPTERIAVANTASHSIVVFDTAGGVADSLADPSIQPNDVAFGITYDLTVATSIQDGISVASASTRLDQSYPNPFNPLTTVRYSIAVGGRVSLHVYDVGGRLVRTLLDESRPPGRGTVTWDGRNDSGTIAPSGVYFIRLAAHGEERVRKTVFLK